MDKDLKHVSSIELFSLKTIDSWIALQWLVCFEGTFKLIIFRYISLDEGSDTDDRLTVAEKAYGKFYPVIKKLSLEVLNLNDSDSDDDNSVSPNVVLRHFFNHAFSLGYKSNFRQKKYKKFMEVMDRLPKVIKVIKALNKHKNNRKQVRVKN